MALFDFLQPDVEKLAQKGDLRGLLKALRYRAKPVIRCRAAEALGNLLQINRDPAAMKPLLDSLRDPDHYVRRAAAHALCCFPDDQTVTALAEALRAPENWREPSVVAAATRTLATIGSVNALELVIAAYQQAVRTSAKNDFGKPIRDDIAQVLNTFKEMPALLQLARNPDPNVRRCAAQQLGKHSYSNGTTDAPGNTDAFETLLSMLDDPEEPVRDAARYYLKYLHDRQFLERMLTSSDAEVRAYAQSELGEVDKRAAQQEAYERREAAKPDYVKTIERNLTSPTPESIRTALAVAGQHLAELPADLIERFVRLHQQAAHATHNKYFSNYGFWCDLFAPIQDLIRRLAKLPQHYVALRSARMQVLANLADADSMEDSAHHIAARASSESTAKLIDDLLPR
jgi:HEAT repeat protein